VRLLPLIALAAACSAFDAGDEATRAKDAGADAPPPGVGPGVGEDGAVADGSEASADGAALTDGALNNDGVLVQEDLYKDPQSGTVANYAYFHDVQAGHLLMMVVAGRFTVNPHQPAGVSAGTTDWTMVAHSETFLPLSAWIAPTDITPGTAVKLDWGPSAPQQQVVLLTEWAVNRAATGQLVDSGMEMSINPPPLQASGSSPRAVIMNLVAVDMAAIAQGPFNGFTEVVPPEPVGNIGFLAAFRVVSDPETGVASGWKLSTKHSYDLLALAFDKP
jgi:hypothetical protein